MSNEEPFSISVPQSALDELQKKLALSKFPSTAPESDNEWDYGVPLKDVQRLIARWKDGYDWRAAEAALNADRKSTRLNSSHSGESRMPSSA